MNFRDPITTFAYNMISLHHDVMWYILIILSVVYWSLYKILKEYIWSAFNKQEGFLLLLYKFKIIINIQIYIFIICFFFFKYIIKGWYDIIKKVIWIIEKSAWSNKGYKTVKFSNFFFGHGYFKDATIINYYSWQKFLTFDYIKDLLIERFLIYYLFNKTSNALYFYDRYEANMVYLNVLGFKHSMKLEYIFGGFPTLIVGLIIAPSMYLLYASETDLDPALTIKVVGHQWYWSYQARSVNILKKTKKIICLDYSYDSVIVNETDLIKGSKRLLETDNSLVLPYNIVIRFLITSSDVLHAWSVPELGIKVDAIPGRLNQITVTANNIGVFYGQCSELCGVSHGFMPIKINVVTLKDYYKLFSNRNK